MSVFRANKYVSAVNMIDVDELCDAGVRCVLVDRDNTLVPRDTKVAPPEVRAWLQDLKSAGISVCMVSNNFHTTAVCKSATDLGCNVVHHAMKPAPFAVFAALSKMGVSKDEAIMVGDQVFTDMLAGNLAGVCTVLVRPQSHVDLWYTNILRKVERLFLKNVHFEGE